jgi:TetR/AcrR family transcriptional regulator, cholesterol catabolism regulator
VRDRAEEVYAAALRLFREKGYHATSMQDIAGVVGLYKGSLYHYIGGKEELLVQVFERGMGALLEEVERIAAEPELAPSVQVRQLIRAHVEAVANNLDALTVYLHEWRALAGESLNRVRSQRERYAQVVTEVIERGVQTGELRTQDTRLATLAVLGMCNWLCQWYRPGGRLSPAEVGDQFADLVLDGLRAPTSSLPPAPARRPSRPTSGSVTTSTVR